MDTYPRGSLSLAAEDDNLVSNRTRPAAADWLATTTALVDSRLARQGRYRTGEPVQVRQWSISRLVHFPAHPAPVWFKEFPGPFADEGQIIRYVSSMMPDTVPEILDSGNGWLLTSEMPAERDSPIGHPLGTMAQIQLASIGKTQGISRLGTASCLDWSFDGLIAELETLARWTDTLPVRDARALDSVLGRLEVLCHATDKLNIPPSLVHGDFCRANSRWTGQGWVIFDWTDSFIGHPFIDVAQSLAEADGNPAIVALYRDLWAAAFSESKVDKALATAPVIGAANHLAMHSRIIDAVHDPSSYMDALLLWVQRLLEAIGR